MPTEVELAADACAGWHNAWLRALGCATERDGDAWRAVDPSPPIYFRAITLREAAPAESLAVPGGAVCDAWARLDLERFGYARHDTEPWFFRPAGPSALVRPTPELEVVRATTPAEIEEFELVSLRGFWREDATIDVGSVHPAS